MSGESVSLRVESGVYIERLEGRLCQPETDRERIELVLGITEVQGKQ